MPTPEAFQRRDRPQRNRYGRWLSRDGLPLYLRPAEIELTAQKSNTGAFKCWKKKIGRCRTAKGGMEDKSFYLGAQESEAKFRAACYLEVWETTPVPPHLTSPAEMVWTREMYERAERLIVQKLAILRLLETEAQDSQDRLDDLRRTYLPIPPQATDNEARHVASTVQSGPAAMAQTASVLSGLYAAIDAYVTSLRQSGMAEKTTERIIENMGALKHYRADVPLAAIDFEWCSSLRNFLIGRPPSRKHDAMLKMLRRKMRDGEKRDQLIERYNRLKETPQRLSFHTIKTIAQHTRQLFSFIEDNKKKMVGWTSPNFDRALRVRKKDVKLLPHEKLALARHEKDQPTVEEIKQLFAVADDRQKLLCMIALFCGFGQTELSTAMVGEFDLDHALLSHVRNKTEVAGCWWLPPELVGALRVHFGSDRHKETELAFRTKFGRPLVTKTSDAVRQMFGDLRNAAGITRRLGFYGFRRFLGSWMKEHGDRVLAGLLSATDLGQTALSQQRDGVTQGDELKQVAQGKVPDTVLDNHYAKERHFRAFHAAQRTMHQQLIDAGVNFTFSNPPTAAPQR